MEFDSRFELVAEWRNPKKLRALRHKDAILAKMFDWMENYKFYFDPTFATKAKSKAAWLARRTRLQKNFFGKDLTKEFPLNMRPSQMDFFVTLDEVGAKMETRLRSLERNKMREKKKVLSFKESLQALDNYRIEEERKISQNRDWLKYFHP